MTVSRDIAQARSYSAAFNVLCLQILAVSFIVAVYGQHWWYGLFVPIGFGVIALHKLSRLIIVIALSFFWALLVQIIAADAGIGAWSFLFAAFAFILSYGVNSAGMIGYLHSIPDLS